MQSLQNLCSNLLPGMFLHAYVLKDDDTKISFTLIKMKCQVYIWYSPNMKMAFGENDSKISFSESSSYKDAIATYTIATVQRVMENKHMYRGAYLVLLNIMLRVKAVHTTNNSFGSI